jgi:hypothetical protein
VPVLIGVFAEKWQLPGAAKWLKTPSIGFFPRALG